MCKNVDCVIWDEVSMNSSRIMEPLHEIAGEVRKNHLAFGGIQVIIVPVEATIETSQREV